MNTSLIQLQGTTGISHIDNLLRALIGIFSLNFPGEMRAAYLFGSYADGTSVTDSDIDLDLVFDKPLDEGQFALARQLAYYVALVSPVKLDCRIILPQHLAHGVPIPLKTALLVYGEDLLSALPVESMDQAQMRDMGHAVELLFLLYNQQGHLVYPLDYPNPLGEFYGYDGYGPGRGTRTLVNCVAMIAISTVSLLAGELIGPKSQAAAAYQTYIGDEWTQFVALVSQTCKHEWHYRIPQELHERVKLRALCEQMLAFSNHYIGLCRERILVNLQDSENSALMRASLRCLRHIVFPSDDFYVALRSLAGVSDPHIAQEARQVLARTEQGRTGKSI